jgi:hypothetical protein
VLWGDEIGEGFGDLGTAQAEVCGHSIDLPGDVAGAQAGDGRGGVTHRSDPSFGEVQGIAPAVQPGVDDQIGERLGLMAQCEAERTVGQQVGRIVVVGEADGVGVEEFVRSDCGGEAGAVTVECDDDLLVGCLGQGVRLELGECRAAQGDTGEVAQTVQEELRATPETVTPTEAKHL